MKEDTIRQVITFRDERDWKKYHNPKDLAISINLEAAELLEIFQWTGSKTDIPEEINNFDEELADILIYCIMMADVLGFDLDEIIKEKLTKNSTKYKT